MPPQNMLLYFIDFFELKVGSRISKYRLNSYFLGGVMFTLKDLYQTFCKEAAPEVGNETWKGGLRLQCTKLRRGSREEGSVCFPFMPFPLESGL